MAEVVAPRFLVVACFVWGCSGTSIEPEHVIPAVSADPAISTTIARHTDVPPDHVDRAITAVPPPRPVETTTTEEAPRAHETFPLRGAAYHFIAQIHAAPSARSPVIGYMRRGTQFDARFVKRQRDCPGGWNALPGRGFVCNANGYVVGQAAQEVPSAPVQARVDEALPYRYARAARDEALQYWRIPGEDEELAAKRDPTSAEVVRMRMQRGFYMSIDRADASSEGAFLRTVRGAYVRAKDLSSAPSTDGQGAHLGGSLRLPIAIVVSDRTTLYTRDTVRGTLRARSIASKFMTFAVATTLDLDGKRYVVARDGTLVRADAVRVCRDTQRPAAIPGNAKHVRINLSDQTLVAYEGDHPVFATLISSGRPGHETPTGLFRIQSKHVSATMDDAAEGDAYSIEDVPWTMYFHDHFALHGAFWHTSFGRPHSRGCVNLTPSDAHWLFDWTTPVLPVSWHGAVADDDSPGTFVHVVP